MTELTAADVCINSLRLFSLEQALRPVHQKLLACVRSCLKSTFFKRMLINSLFNIKAISPNFTFISLMRGNNQGFTPKRFKNAKVSLLQNKTSLSSGLK